MRRVCKVCQTEKEIEEFGSSIAKSNGKRYYRHECNGCISKQGMEKRGARGLKSRRFTAEEDRTLREQYPANGGKFCAELLGRSVSMVRARVIRLGIKVDPSSAKARLGEAIRERHRQKPWDQYNVNPARFTIVDSPEAAYILGLLWADGYVISNQDRGEVRLSLVKEDADEVAPTFLKTGQWRLHERQPTDKRSQTVRRLTGWIETHNRPLADYLLSKDYGAKGHVSADKILETIPAHLRHYWFRGLFDGDGSLYLNPDGKHVAFGISSSFEQDWSYLAALFDSWGDDHYRVHRKVVHEKSRFSKFDVVRRASILKFCEYIYQSYEQDKIGLTRKWGKYMKLIELDKRLTESRSRYHIGRLNLGIERLQRGKHVTAPKIA